MANGDEEKAPTKSAAQRAMERAGLSELPTLTPTSGAAPRFLGPPVEYFADPKFEAPPDFRPFTDADPWGPQAWSSESIPVLQQRMADVGLYGGGSYRPGIWADEDARAFTKVLEFANAKFIQDPIKALSQYGRQQQVSSPRVQAPQAPLVTQYANPESVRQIIRDSSFRMLGRRLSDDEEGRLIGAYQAQSAAAQQAEHTAGAAAGGGSYTLPMDAETFAESQIEEQHGPEAGAVRGVEAFEQILGDLGPMVSRPRQLGQQSPMGMQ